LYTIKAGEKLTEALDVAEEAAIHWSAYEKALEEEKKMSQEELAMANENGMHVTPPDPNPLMLGKTPLEYMLHELKSIKSSDLEEAILMLPFASVIKFFNHLDHWIKKGVELELMCRSVFLLLKAHHNQIVANKTVIATLDSLKKHTKTQLQQQRDIIGFNRAAMNYFKRSIEAETATISLPQPISTETQPKKKARKENK